MIKIHQPASAASPLTSHDPMMINQRRIANAPNVYSTLTLYKTSVCSPSAGPLRLVGSLSRVYDGVDLTHRVSVYALRINQTAVHNGMWSAWLWVEYDVVVGAIKPGFIAFQTDVWFFLSPSLGFSSSTGQLGFLLQVCYRLFEKYQIFHWILDIFIDFGVLLHW